MDERHLKICRSCPFFFPDVHECGIMRKDAELAHRDCELHPKNDKRVGGFYD